MRSMRFRKAPLDWLWLAARKSRMAIVYAIFAVVVVVVSAPAAICQTRTTCADGPDPTSLDANCSAEIYDPKIESFGATGSMTNAGGRWYSPNW
jgi:hypothetical protein